MKKPVAPCIECEDREPGCHTECPGYIDFVKENKLYTDKVKEARGAAKFWNDNIAKRTRWDLNRKKGYKRKR